MHNTSPSRKKKTKSALSEQFLETIHKFSLISFFIFHYFLTRSDDVLMILFDKHKDSNAELWTVRLTLVFDLNLNLNLNSNIWIWYFWNF